MEKMSNLWVDTCEELWIMTDDRPYLKDSTVWDAFKLLYMSMVRNPGGLQSASVLGDD